MGTMHETLTNAAVFTAAQAPAPAAAQRVDLYKVIHKGLRACMTDALGAVSRVDPADGVEVAAALATVRELLVLCRGHLAKEERYIHPAMEARAYGSTRAVAEDHVGHLAAFDRLESAMAAIEVATEDTRTAPLLALYHALTLFVAENFEHMHVEETQHNAVLQAHFSDAELLGIEASIVGSLTPAELGGYLKWMGSAANAAERAELLRNVRAKAPAPAFAAIKAALRSRLSERDWTKLEAALAQ